MEGGGHCFVLFGKALVWNFECMSTSPIFHAYVHACLAIYMRPILNLAGLRGMNCETWGLITTYACGPLHYIARYS